MSAYSPMMWRRPVDVGTLFTAADQIEALKEGWYVSENGDIEDDLSLTFATQAEARAWVEKRADEGSDLHERALAAVAAIIIRNVGRNS